MSPINTGAFGGETAEPAKPERRKRRTKAELIADAVVPADNEMVSVKFISTGMKADREWAAAVVLFDEGKIEFADKNMKYAVEKSKHGAPAPAEPTRDPAEEAGISVEALNSRWSDIQLRLDAGNLSDSDVEQGNEEAELVRQEIIRLGGVDPASEEAYAARSSVKNAFETGPSGGYLGPDEAQVGDEVVVDGQTMYVGHNANELIRSKPTQGPNQELIDPSTRWEKNDAGAWVGTNLKQERVHEAAAQEGFFDSQAASTPPSSIKASAFSGEPVESTVSASGGGSYTVTSTPVNPEITQVSPKGWRVGTGVLEKIGLPDFSGLQVGPNTMSGFVIDDGRRIKVKMPQSDGDGREVMVPTIAVEEFGLIADTVEYVTRLQRGHLIAFLEAVKPGSTMPKS